MNRKRKIAFLFTALIFIVGVSGMWRFSEGQSAEKQLNHERCAEEAKEMVGDFLRMEGQKTYAQKGSFVRLAGGGYARPGPWNIQGGFYLSLNPVACFSGGTEQIQIIVRKGDKKAVSQPRPEYPVIYVSNPELWED